MRGYGQFDEEIFVQEGLNSRSEYENWKKDTKEKLLKLDELVGNEYKIPPITHVVYFTFDKTPQSMKPLYIKKYMDSSTRLNLEDSNFKHILWTNNFDAIPEEVKQLPGVEVRLCKEFKDHPLYSNLNNFIEQGQNDSRKFVEASDVARVIAIQQYGGIYHDLDYEVYDAKAMISFMKAFEHFNAKEAERWDASIGNAFIANAPNHPVINKTAEILKRNLNQDEATPDYIKYPKNKFDGVIMRTGPVAITMANYLVGSKDGIIFPDKIIYNADYARNPSSLELPKFWFEGIEIKTVGGDMFSGSWGTSDYLHDINYDDVPGRKLNDIEIYKKIQKIITNNQQEKLSQLLLNIDDAWIINHALYTAVNNNNTEAFHIILSKVNYNVSSDVLREAVVVNNLEMLNALLERITDEEVIYEGLGSAIDSGNKEIFDILLPKTSKIALLSKALYRAINKDQIEMLKELLFKIPEEYSLNDALLEVVSQNKKEIFEIILPKVSDPKTMQSALNEMIRSYKDNDEIFDSLLLIFSDQEILGQALCNTASSSSSYSDKKFGRLLSKVTDQEWLGKALKLSTERYSQNKFAEILPKITDQEVLAEVFRVTLSQYFNENFYEILPRITDQEVLADALKIQASSSKYQAKFDRILPKITDKKVLTEALEIAVENGCDVYVVQILERLPEVTQEKIEQIFDQGIVKGYYNIAKQLLPQITDQKRFEQILPLAIKYQDFAVTASLIDKVNQEGAFDEALMFPLLRNYKNYQENYNRKIGNTKWDFKFDLEVEEFILKIIPRINSNDKLEEILNYVISLSQCNFTQALVDKINKQEALEITFKNFIDKYIDKYNLMTGISEFQKKIYNIFLPKIISQEVLGYALYYITSHDGELMDELLFKVTDQILLGEALGRAIYDEIKFNKLILKVTDQGQLTDVLSCVARSGRWELFDKVLPKITEQKYLAEIVIIAIIHNKKDLSDSYLDMIMEENYIAEILKTAIKYNKGKWVGKYFNQVIRQELLDDIFICAVKNNNQEISAKLLPNLENEKILKEALDHSIRNNKQELTKLILENINEQELLKWSLEKSVEYNDFEILKKLLTKITDHKFIDETLKAKIIHLEQNLESFTKENKYWKFKEEKEQLEEFKMMLAIANSNQDSLESIFVNCVESDNKKLISILLPTVKNQEVLGKALEKSMHHRSLDLFKDILVKITDQSFIDNIFIKAVEEKNNDVISILLPTIKNQEVLGKALEESTHHRSLNLFKDILVKITDQSFIDNIFIKAVEENNKNVISILLPSIVNQDVLKAALEETITQSTNLETIRYDRLSIFQHKKNGEPDYTSFGLFKVLLSKIDDYQGLNEKIEFVSEFASKEKLASKNWDLSLVGRRFYEIKTLIQNKITSLENRHFEELDVPILMTEVIEDRDYDQQFMGVLEQDFFDYN